MGVIDTLSAGFRLVFRRPWLAGVPLLINVAVWRMPKLSMSVIVERMLASLTAWAATAAGADETLTDSVAQMGSLMREAVGSANLFGLLAWNSLGVPSIAASLPIQAGDRVIQLSQTWQLALAEVAILAIGLLFAAVDLILIGHSVGDVPVELKTLAPEIASSWARLGLVVIFIGIGAASALLASAVLGPLSLVVLLGLMWILVYISFFPQAITLAGQKPLAAVVSSLNVVRSSLWPTLGLLLLVNMLDTGLALVWQRVIGTAPVGVLVAIVANSLLGTGLTSALFYFYQDRSAALRSLVAASRGT